jgi:HEAT repeat protein
MRWNIGADPSKRFVFCRTEGRPATLDVLDERTGRVRRMTGLFFEGNLTRLGPDGRIYQMDHSLAKGGLLQRDADGTVLPFPSSGRVRLPTVPSGTTAWERDFYVDRRGDIYAKQRSGKQPYHGLMRVDQFGGDGAFKRTAIWVTSDGGLGPKVDTAGNLYLVDAVQPVGQAYPAELAPHLKTGEQKHWAEYMYGSLIKFGPAGGAIWFPAQPIGEQPLFPDLVKPEKVYAYPFEGPCTLDPGLNREKVAYTMRKDPVDIQGAPWWRFGVSPVLDMNTGRGPCHCIATDFDLDGFGRVLVPDQGRFRVTLYDANGNEIAHFGRYGNQGDRGPGIAFAWIVGVAATDRHVYVADALNRRVVRCRLGHEAEAVGLIEWPGGSDATSVQVAEARQEAAAICPAMADLDWHAVDLAVRRRSASPTLADARAETCLALRDAAALPADGVRSFLQQCLADTNTAVRHAAVRAMDAGVAQPVAVDLLKGALKDSDEVVRTTAAIRLYRLRDQSGLGVILLSLGSASAAPCELAEVALMEYLVESAGPGTKADSIFRRAVAPTFAVTPEAVDALLPLLRAKNGYVRKTAIYCLGLSGDPRAVDPMREAIRAGETGWQLGRLIGSLEFLGGRAAVPELIEVLRKAEKDEELGWSIAQRAGQTLQALADRAAVPALLELFDDTRTEVRNVARVTVSRIVDPQVPVGECLVPVDGKLERRPLADAPAQLRADWEAYWKTAGKP